MVLPARIEPKLAARLDLQSREDQGSNWLKDHIYYQDMILRDGSPSSCGRELLWGCSFSLLPPIRFSSASSLFLSLPSLSTARTSHRSPNHSRATSNYSLGSNGNSAGPSSPSAGSQRFVNQNGPSSRQRQTSSNQKTPPGNFPNQFNSNLNQSPRVMTGISANSSTPPLNSTPPTDSRNGMGSEWSTQNAQSSEK